MTINEYFDDVSISSSDCESESDPESESETKLEPDGEDGTISKSDTATERTRSTTPHRTNSQDCRYELEQTPSSSSADPAADDQISPHVTPVINGRVVRFLDGDEELKQLPSDIVRVVTEGCRDIVFNRPSFLSKRNGNDPRCAGRAIKWTARDTGEALLVARFSIATGYQCTVVRSKDGNGFNEGATGLLVNAHRGGQGLVCSPDGTRWSKSLYHIWKPGMVVDEMLSEDAKVVKMIQRKENSKLENNSDKTASTYHGVTRERGEDTDSQSEAVRIGRMTTSAVSYVKLTDDKSGQARQHLESDERQDLDLEQHRVKRPRLMESRSVSHGEKVCDSPESTRPQKHEEASPGALNHPSWATQSTGIFAPKCPTDRRLKALLSEVNHLDRDLGALIVSDGIETIQDLRTDLRNMREKATAFDELKKTREGSEDP